MRGVAIDAAGWRDVGDVSRLHEVWRGVEGERLLAALGVSEVLEPASGTSERDLHMPRTALGMPAVEAGDRSERGEVARSVVERLRR